MRALHASTSPGSEAGLDALGVPYTIDHRLVRGFDYYTRTTFEFSSGAIEAAQNALGGGGRYDGLVEVLGGPATPGIGFGIGVERILMACDAEGVFPTSAPPLDAYVIDIAGGEAAVALTTELRRAGLRADRAFDGRSMKTQIKSADRSGALVALVVGPPRGSRPAPSACGPCAWPTWPNAAWPGLAIASELRACHCRALPR